MLVLHCCWFLLILVDSCWFFPVLGHIILAKGVVYSWECTTTVQLTHGNHPPIGVYGLKEYPKKMSYLSRNQRIATDVVRKARFAINQLTKPWKKVNKPKSWPHMQIPTRFSECLPPIMTRNGNLWWIQWNLRKRGTTQTSHQTNTIMKWG